MTKIFVAGHKGMVGSAIIRELKKNANNQILISNREEVDLTNQRQVELFFKRNNIDQVYLAAAKVGGIHANNEYPAEFVYENLMIQSNVINSSHNNGVQKLLFLGSSCIYPKLADQPMSEKSLLQGSLEETNEPYAIAKIAGIKLCESYNRQYSRDYRCVMPTNLYGENDNFHVENSHVIPALIRRFHEAKENNDKEVFAWGSGAPMREFLYVDEMAEASIFIMNLNINEYRKRISPMLSHINIGTGIDCTIKELVETVAKVIGYSGRVIFDSSKPDGAPRKLLDVSLLNSLGWSSKVELEDGLKSTYQWYLSNIDSYRN